MEQGRRYGLSATEKADIWRRWKGGESLHEIGRAFGKNHGSIQFLLSHHGGIALGSPPPFTKANALTLAERGRHFPRYCLQVLPIQGDCEGFCSGRRRR